MKNRKDTKGALPVPYIVALVIAVVVIALLAILFLSSYIQSKEKSSEIICRAKEIAYCTAWAATGYNPDSMPEKKLFSEQNPDCATYAWAKSVSKGVCVCLLNPLDSSCQNRGTNA
jgi:hypothetical protein